jgi:hypothetical protein
MSFVIQKSVFPYSTFPENPRQKNKGKVESLPKLTTLEKIVYTPAGRSTGKESDTSCRCNRVSAH